MAEHGLAVGAVQVIAVEQRRPGALEMLPEQRLALDEREPAQVLVAEMD